jgi:hypothetical protein
MGNPHAQYAGPAGPRVLLTDTNRWALAARLAIELADAGCEVAAVCPAPSHALMKTRAVRRIFRYNAFRPVESLRGAITEFEPDFIIPACDRSVEHLHELYMRAKSQGRAEDRIIALIERSLGSPANHEIVSSRYELMSIAQEAGVRVPTTIQIHSRDRLNSPQMNGPFPRVIKIDGTWGGVGVRVVHSDAEIQKSWAELTQISRFARAMKRVAVNRDQFLLRSWWNHQERTGIIQSYIDGRPANCAVFAWRGEVLALIAVEVIRSAGGTGPANIVRLVENAEMRFAAERIAHRLELSGFFGLDFMIEHGSQNVYLVEMNPRLTPPCHLRLGKGRDLVGAFWATLTGQTTVEYTCVTQSDIIAYQSHSPDLIADSYPNCFHDFPHDDPELARELMNPFPDRTLLFRLAQHFSRKPAASGGVFEMPIEKVRIRPS